VPNKPTPLEITLVADLARLGLSLKNLTTSLMLKPVPFE
jgi:hypothetical protein